MDIQADHSSLNGQTPDQMRETMHRKMLSTVSHDLKSPLSAIIGSIEIYKRMSAKLSLEQKNDLMNSALVEAYRLDHFITNILDMANLENDMTKVHFQDSNLVQIIQETIAQPGSNYGTGDIEFRPQNPSHLVHTDPALLKRTIGIILDNAFKFAVDTPKITLIYKTSGSNTNIYIQDNGPGIPEGEESNIFTKYTRFSNQKHNTGAGLGLTICAEIMKRLNGSVSAKNHPEGGAEFLISFPTGRQNA